MLLATPNTYCCWSTRKTELLARSQPEEHDLIVVRVAVRRAGGERGVGIADDGQRLRGCEGLGDVEAGPDGC